MGRECLVERDYLRASRARQASATPVLRRLDARRQREAVAIDDAAQRADSLEKLEPQPPGAEPFPAPKPEAAALGENQRPDRRD